METLARLAYQYPKRRRLRALIVQGAAASLTDKETRDRLRNEQLVRLNAWIVGYERERHRLGIDDSVDIQAAVLYTWAAEVGLKEYLKQWAFSQTAGEVGLMSPNGLPDHSCFRSPPASQQLPRKPGRSELLERHQK